MANISDFEFRGLELKRECVSEPTQELPQVSASLLGCAKSRAAKRSLDAFGALLATVFLSPLFVFVAVAIYCIDGGPVVIAHHRVGLGGRLFPCFKFRSMVQGGHAVLTRHLDANPEARREWDENRKLRNDPRITPLGQVLRKTSLDELPQLFNILRGEMSLVGPRPVVTDELVKYGHNVVDYLSVRPGLTGMWQVNGRCEVQYHERVALDVAYARRRTFLKDLVILLKTLPAVIASKGSY